MHKRARAKPHDDVFYQRKLQEYAPQWEEKLRDAAQLVITVRNIMYVNPNRRIPHKKKTFEAK